MNTQRLPGLAAGIFPACAILSKVTGCRCTNSAACSRLNVRMGGMEAINELLP
jgi:hypothetical protein